MIKNYIPIVLLAFICYGSAGKVPLMVWSNGKQLPQNELSSSSLLDDVYPGDLLNEYSSDDQTKKIAFIQNNIDIEQFSNAKLPFISKLFEENHAIFYPYSHYEPSVYSSFDSLVSLEGDSLEQNEPTIKSFMANQTGSALFMLTGKNNLRYELLNDESPKSRLRRQADDNKIVKIWESPCAYVHVSKVELYDPDFKVENSISPIEFNVENMEANCSNNTNNKARKEAESVRLNLKEKNGAKSLGLDISFEFLKNSMWKISSVKIVELTKSNRWNASKGSTDFVEDGFSYSCSKLTFKFSPNEKPKDNVLIQNAKIVLRRFQIQPFVYEESLTKFEESFDCAVWFTLPIISSLLVVLLLVLILYCGIRAVMSISTPDRFENPKSKGLILTVEE